MLLRCGLWFLDTDVKQKEGKVYFVAKHSCNPTKVELVFLKNNKKGKWSGKKELIDFIEKEKLYY